MDEPDLPPLPAINPSYNRKRTRPEYEPATSSDPALFSSDEHAPSAENYASKRRKEQYAGTWWGAKAMPLRRKKSFRRNFDSGIFLGSEETDTSLEDELLRDQERQALDHSVEGPVTPAQTSNNPDISLFRQCISKPAPSKHDLVRVIVQRALDQGLEDVDLSSMSLDTLPSDITNLKSLTKHTSIPQSTTTPRDSTYHPLEAHLRLYLSHNTFTRLPSEILQLTNLRLLSLRNNSLTNLTPALSRLTNLQTLNISNNKLTSLPFELLTLLFSGSLKELIAEPNPWRLTPDTADISPPKNPFIGKNGAYLRQVALGEVSLLRPNGALERRLSSLFENPRAGEGYQACPPLAVLALNRMSKLQALQSLDSWVNDGDGIPDSVQTMLYSALYASQAGHRKCRSCNTEFMIPRKQWIEWWTIDFKPSGPFLKIPFLRHQCYGCYMMSAHMDGRVEAEKRLIKQRKEAALNIASSLNDSANKWRFLAEKSENTFDHSCNPSFPIPPPSHISSTATYHSLSYANSDTALTKIPLYASLHYGAGPEQIYGTFKSVRTMWTTAALDIEAAFKSGQNVAMFGKFVYKTVTLGESIKSPIVIHFVIKDVDIKRETKMTVTYMRFMKDTLRTTNLFRVERHAC